MLKSEITNNKSEITKMFISVRHLPWPILPQKTEEYFFRSAAEMKRKNRARKEERERERREKIRKIISFHQDLKTDKVPHC